MGVVFTNCDCLREYHTGAGADGDVQDDATLSIGGFRSSSLAATLGMQIAAPIKNKSITFASPNNPTGPGVLTALDSVTLSWQPYGAAVAGEPEVFTLGSTETHIVEGVDPTHYLVVQATPPFLPGSEIVTLFEVLESVVSLDNVLDADATAGINQYRAVILKNRSNKDVMSFQRWLGTLGTSQTSNEAVLGGAGSGAVRSSSVLSDWPTSGWCQIMNGSSIREVVYYSSRTLYELTVPAAGRGMLGTSAAAGALTDTINAVPGIAIALDPNGVQDSGSSIELLADDVTAPAGVTWNLSTTAAAGLQIPRLAPGKQVGVWIWRHIPAGAIYIANAHNKIKTSFVS